MTSNSSGAVKSRRVGQMTIREISETQAEITREFNVPRRLLFEAMSKCEHMQHWWGPRTTSLTSCQMDFRVGGTWRFVLTDSDGNPAAFRGEYREIVPHERMVQTFEFEGVPGAISVEEMTLQEHDGKTTLRVVTSLASKEALEGYLASGMEQGAAETYERLEEYSRTLA